ncbi:MAG: hypothetical protein IT290_00185, partial [Deltaproteobacteria bacterium]|nr:hypothetical protein [Deltaproteobacteria bacterium]
MSEFDSGPQMGPQAGSPLAGANGHGLKQQADRIVHTTGMNAVGATKCGVETLCVNNLGSLAKKLASALLG